MLPNHAPLVVAEQFGMLEALHPGRIDLGIGRAPGTDPVTARGAAPGRLRSAPTTFPTSSGAARLLRRSAPPAGSRRSRTRLPARGVAARLERLQARSRRARAAVLVRAPLHAAATRWPRSRSTVERSVFPETLAEPHAVIGVAGGLRRDRRARPLAARLREALLPAPPYRSSGSIPLPRRPRPTSTRPTSSSSSRAGPRPTSSARLGPCATRCSSFSGRRRPTS